ncbi:MAG: dockerin type I repeat-containing protein [Clostridia bacterium]|nr:dockerin type I repeat-containing protein [Clostridia bacterium]
MKKKILSIILTLVMLMGIFAPAGILTASAASPVEGATGAGTEADPLIVDDMVELKKALAYNGTLYIVAKNFPTELISFGGTIELPYYEVVSKKVLTLKQNLEVKCLNGDTSSLFRVNDGADFTIIADGSRNIEYTYTVFELAGPTAKLTLKGEIECKTTTDDGSLNSYALVAHQGNVFLDSGNYENVDLFVDSASLRNGTTVLKNCRIGKLALMGTAFKLYPGSVGYFKDERQDFYTTPDFGATEVIKEDLRVACIGGFNEQSPALEGTDTTITAPEEKVILGMSKKYSFSTANNTAWAENCKYTPTGTIQVVDNTNNLIYSASDSDSGTFDRNVNLSIDLKDIIKTPGKYRIIEIIRLTRDGTDATKYVHIYPIEVVDFNTFLGQSPAMPAGYTEFYLGAVSQESYPVKFYAQPLSQSMIDEGYSSTAKLQIYTVADNTYVYGEKAYCDKGQKISYDLINLPADSYYFVETIELRDKNNNVVKSAVNTFAIDWIPDKDIEEVNVNASWQGAIKAPVSATKGVTVTDYRWEKYDGSDWNTFTGTINGGRFRCMVELTAESGYTLASDYTVKIGGITAKRYTGNVWYVARDITGYITLVDVMDFDAPEAGAYPVFEGYSVDSANTLVKLVEWYKCNADGKKLSAPLTAEDMFEKDSYYRLEVTVVPATNYEFHSSDLGFYINSDIVHSYYPHSVDIPGSITGFKVYHVDDIEGSFELYLYDGNQTGAAKDIIIKDGQYIASDSATPVSTKPSGGYAYYKDGVLTFEAYNNAKAHFVFEEGNLDVYLKGRNRIGAIYNSEYLGEINGLDKREGNMTISTDENGSLTVASNPLDAYCNIYVNTLTFNSGKVVSCLANGTYASALYAEKLFIADGYNVYVGETDDFGSAEEWDGTTDIKNYENVWLDKGVCKHNYVKYEKAEPTCKEEGLKETFELCQDCKLSVKKENGEILTGDDATAFLADVIIPKGDHAYKFIAKHAATCNSTGAKSDYWLCTVCNTRFVTDAKTPITLHEYSKNIHLPAFGHKMEEVAAVDATCTTDGNIAYYRCTREECAKLYADDKGNTELAPAEVVVTATGHTEEVIPGKAATETETGLTAGKKCSVCDEILVHQTEIPKLEPGHTHSYTDVVTDPTCKDKGFTTHTCACGDVIVDTYTDPTDVHTPVAVPGKAPTYTETGLTDGEKCSVCDKVLKEQEVIGKLPISHTHEYTDTVVDPTCKDKGYTKHVCVCGDTVIDTYVDATGNHTPEIIPGKPATTTETGLTDGEKCSVCGTVTKEQTVIDKIPEDHKHTPGEWVVVTPAEVGVEGKEVKKCTDCNAVVEERVIPALENPDADIMLGDVNKDGKITAADARLALRISAKLDTADEYRFVAADMDKNGKITAADARKILRISAKLD